MQSSYFDFKFFECDFNAGDILKWLQRFFAARIFIWIRLKICRMTIELSLRRSSQIIRTNYKAKRMNIFSTPSNKRARRSWIQGWTVSPVLSVNIRFIRLCQTNCYATCFRPKRMKLAQQETTWSWVHNRVEYNHFIISFLRSIWWKSSIFWWIFHERSMCDVLNDHHNSSVFIVLRTRKLSDMFRIRLQCNCSSTRNNIRQIWDSWVLVYW